MGCSQKMRRLVALFAVTLTALSAPIAHAATTPSLGAASGFGILAFTYVNNLGFTSITGDLGYTHAPSVLPTVSGATHVNDATYVQAVADQNTALAALNSQSCTFTFAPGTVDLATDSTHGPVGFYTPGVYCINGSMTVSGNVQTTMNGAGTYIFRPTGALTVADDAWINGTNNVSACDIFWTPGSSTSIGSVVVFAGTVIEPLSAVPLNISVGAHTNWGGRALDGTIMTAATVTTDVDVTMSVLSCSPPPPATGTLHVIKTFYNDYGGTAVPSDAIVHVKNGAGDVVGSPHAGAVAPGTSYTLNADTYTVSEDAYAGYTPIFSGDCDASGHVALGAGESKTCTISNDQNPPPPASPATLHVIKHVVNDNGGTATAASFMLHVKGSGVGGLTDVVGSPAAGVESPGTPYATLASGSYVVSEDAHAGYTRSFSGDCDASGHVTLAAGDDKICTITNNDIYTPPTPTFATLHVIKHVVNNDGGTAAAGSFTLHVKGSGVGGLTDVAGSPAAGTEAPGTAYILDAGAYVLSEDPHAGYTSDFSGHCDDGGVITLVAGDDKTCTITNDDVKPPTIVVPPATLHVIKIVINDNGGKANVSDAVMHVTSGLGDVAGSPQAGASAPGTSYVLAPGTYNVSENFFAGYTVLVGGDCGANGDIALASGDDKTCTITNNDIAGVIYTPPVVPPPPSTVTAPCDICGRLTYDLYIINPNGTERHSGTSWVRVTDRGNKILRYSFEDLTLDPTNSNYDYNDAVVDVDFTDCKRIRFLFVSSDADWQHKIRFRVSIDGVRQSDTLVTNDSKAVVGTSKIVDATTGVKVASACPAGAPTLNGRILLQVQQHGEAWYVRPENGLRYYMKDGPTAYGMMRNFGLGITDADLATIASVDGVDALKLSSSVCSSNATANAVKGKILLQVQQHGEAWYVDAPTCRRIYMKDGAAAYTLMRFLGLGITDADLAKITIGQ